MEASAWRLYERARSSIVSRRIILWVDTFAMMLLAPSYIPNWESDAFWIDVSAHELPTGGGYTAGGMVLELSGAKSPRFARVSPSWEKFTAGPFRYGAIVHRAERSVTPHDLLLCCSDFGMDYRGNGKEMAVEFHDCGIFELI